MPGLMTSTQVDESAQHFYRKIGYKDCGCLVLDIPELEQPMEMFLINHFTNYFNQFIGLAPGLFLSEYSGKEKQNLARRKPVSCRHRRYSAVFG